MNTNPPVLVAAALSILALTGCQSTPMTTLRVSGTPGAAFTAHYRSGTLEGTVATEAAESPSIVLETRGGRFEAEVSKKDPATELTVEIRKGSRTVFQATSPMGVHGLRIAEKQGGWTTEPIP